MRDWDSDKGERVQNVEKLRDVIYGWSLLPQQRPRARGVLEGGGRARPGRQGPAPGSVQFITLLLQFQMLVQGDSGSLTAGLGLTWNFCEWARSVPTSLHVVLAQKRSMEGEGS